MRIVLVYLCINTPQNYGFNYGLSYIGKMLKNAGFRVKYEFLQYESDFENFYKILMAYKPSIIGFSVTSSQFIYLKMIVPKIKLYSKAFIVCGGAHPTLVPESINEVPGVNAYIIGEGEYPMLELANAVKNKVDYYHIKNLWTKADGRIIKNEIRPVIEILDELPFPDLQPMKPVEIKGEKGIESEIRFNFSRGCPFDCSYCCNKAFSMIYPNPQKYFRQRSPQNAIREIEMANEKYRFSFINFDDDCLTLNRGWFKIFIDLYKKKFKYPFRCNIRVGTLDEELAIQLKEAGAKNIGIGLEQGNEKFRVEVLKKNITNKQIEETFYLVEKHNLSHLDFIMVGFPFENRALFRDTVKLCRKVSAKGGISIFYPYPGTELGEICKQNNWLPNKESYREREEATISYPNFSNTEIQAAANAFPFLIALKSIPLQIPFELVPFYYFVYMGLKGIYNFYLLKIVRLFTFSNRKMVKIQPNITVY